MQGERVPHANRRNLPGMKMWWTTDFSSQQQPPTTIPVDSDVFDSNRNEENPVSDDTEQGEGRTSLNSLVNVEADMGEPSTDFGRIQSMVADLPPFPSMNTTNIV